MLLRKNKTKYFITPLVISLIGNNLLSCGSSNSFEINWLDGTTINCLSEEYNNYHTVNEIKNAVKQKVDVSPDITISSLPNWSDNNFEKEKMYYDLVASLIFINTNFVPFYLEISCTDDKITSRTINLIYKNKPNINELVSAKPSNETISGIPSYIPKDKIVYIYLADHMISKSYKFLNTRYEGEK